MGNYIMTAEELKSKVDLALSVETLYCNGGLTAPCGWGNNRERFSRNQSASRRAKIYRASDSTFLMDCICSIKCFLWGFRADVNAQYGGAVYESNGVPDTTIDAFKDMCLDWSQDFSNIQPMEFIRLHSRHCALYYGDDLVAEAADEGADGYQLSPLSARNWEGHGKLPWVDYGSQPTPPEPPKPQRVEVDGSWGRNTSFNFQDVLGCVELDAVISRQPKGNKGNLPNVVVKDADNPRGSWEFKGFPANLGGSAAIKAWQRHLKGLGYYGGVIDGWCGPQTITASQLYLRDLGYYTGEIDASMGPLTVMAFQMWINAQ